MCHSPCTSLAWWNTTAAGRMSVRSLTKTNHPGRTRHKNNVGSGTDRQRGPLHELGLKYWVSRTTGGEAGSDGHSWG